MSIQKTSAEAAGGGPIPNLLRRALFPVPGRYTFRIFVTRMGYHLCVYSLLLFFAILLVMFIYRPIETGFILAVLVVVHAGISKLVAGGSSREVPGIYAASNIPPVILYIIAASFLWKEITDGGLSRMLERLLY